MIPKRGVKTHVIPSSRLLALLILGSLLAVWNWTVAKPLAKAGRPVRISGLVPPRIGYAARIYTYDDESIQSELPAVRTAAWTTRCFNECGAEKARGICDGQRCVCYEGYGGMDCSIGLDTFFLDHDVYENLTLRPLDVSGWDMGGDLYQHLVSSASPYLVVEIGVWKGASASKLAAALNVQGMGVLLAVDTWLPVLQFWKDQKAMNRMKDLHFQNGYPTLMQTFLSNVFQQNLSDFVIPLPAMSRTAAELLFSRGYFAELIHIDAGHTYEDTEEDIRLWWRVLREGGILLGDDWSGTWPGVARAVREHATKYRIDIHRYRNKWWLYKPATVKT